MMPGSPPVPSNWRRKILRGVRYGVWLTGSTSMLMSATGFYMLFEHPTVLNLIVSVLLGIGTGVGLMFLTFAAIGGLEESI